MAHYSEPLSYTARLKACSKSSDEILGTLCEPCSEVGKRVEAKGYCCTCSQYLCTDCCKYHKTLRTLRNHKLLEGSDYVQATRGSMHCFEICHIHKQHSLDQYCKTHEQLCCKMCVRTLHQECKAVNFIKDISEGIRHDSATKKNSDGIRSSLLQLKLHRKRYDDCIKDASSQHRDAAAAIEAFTATLKERLNRSEKNANSELKSCYEKDLSDLEEHRSMVDTAIAELEEAVQKLDDAMERGDNDSVFIHLVKAKQKNTEYDVLAEESPKEQKLKFLPNKELDRQTGLPQMLGRVELRRFMPLPGRVVPSSRKPKVAKRITHGTYTCRYKNILKAAIDIGRLSGLGYSFLDRDDVYSRSWTDVTGMETEYPPCNVSIDPCNNELVEYGSEAESEWKSDLECEIQDPAYYFPKFDIQLHRLFEDNEVRLSDVMIQDVNGRPFPAKKLLSTVIRFLSLTLSTILQRTCLEIGLSDVNWILTLPAVWCDDSEEFIYEAAIEAGLGADNVALAYTSDAAFAYCRDTVPEVKAGLTRDGRVIQLDVGEDFTELTIHQIQGSDENIHAIRGWWGSGNIKENYDLLLGELFGPEEVKEFKKTAEGPDASYLDDFVRATHAVFRRPVNIQIPVGIGCGENRADIGKGTMYEGGVTCKRRATILAMEEWVVRSMFKPVVDGSINLLQTIMEQDIGRNISVLVMTGNFSKSEILHGAIREAFPELKVVQPESPTDAVRIGACKHTTVVARYM